MAGWRQAMFLTGMAFYLAGCGGPLEVDVVTTAPIDNTTEADINLNEIVVEVAPHPVVEALIDDLVNVSEPGLGYCGGSVGSVFLPYEETAEVHVVLFGAAPPNPSPTLRKLVELGAEAVPQLLKHIGDNRKINMASFAGMFWTEFSDEYEYDWRTTKTIPKGVNRDAFHEEGHPRSHAVTVGDLCFVALGQIVNRHFTAARYQASGGMVINSPTHSKRLRYAILKEWNGLTPELHKERLIRDFQQSDSISRRLGAYRCFSFYYPEEVERLVLGEFEKPMYFPSGFCHQVLYQEPDEQIRKTKFDEFVRENGAGSALGVRDLLVSDLERAEIRGLHNYAVWLGTEDYETAPDKLLIQLFHERPNLASPDFQFRTACSYDDRDALIRVLVHDDSQKIGDVVKQIFMESRVDVPGGETRRINCMYCLAARGYGEFLLNQLDGIDVRVPESNSRHHEYLMAISNSDDPEVRDKLMRAAEIVANEDYFMALLPVFDNEHDAQLLKLARKFLSRLPKNTEQGQDLLRMIRVRYPDEAKAIFQSFLAPNTVERADTMCSVLWYGDPLSKELLVPLLDDKRTDQNERRVCDQAAQAISHASQDEINFDSDWPTKQKDTVIRKIKHYCREATKPLRP